MLVSAMLLQVYGISWSDPSAARARQRLECGSLLPLSECRQNRARAADPGYLQGVLAYAYAVALNWSLRPEALPAESVLARGVATAGRALQEDSSISDAWLGRGMVLFFRGRREDLDIARRTRLPDPETRPLVFELDVRDIPPVG